MDQRYDDILAPIVNIIAENKEYILEKDGLSTNAKCKLALKSNNYFPKGDLENLVIIPYKDGQRIEINLMSPIKITISLFSTTSGAAIAQEEIPV